MNRFDTPIVSILFTIALLVGLYFAYLWVFDEFEKQNLMHYTEASSGRINLGISGDKRIGNSYSGPNVNAGGRNRRSSTLHVTGVPPTAEAFAASLMLANPQEGSAMPGNNSLTRRRSSGFRSTADQPMVYATRPSDKVNTELGGISGGMGTGAFFGQRRGTSESSVRPQGAVVIAQNNLEIQPRPFKAGEEPINPPNADPGSDPLSSEQIPIPDGLFVLVLMASGYSLWKLYRK